MKKRNLLLGAAVLIVLTVTHWFAYDSGVQSVLASDTSRREFARADEPFDELLCQVDVLRVAAKCPDVFSEEELRRWRAATEATIQAAETIGLVYYEKSGDEGREAFVRRKIGEARDLLAKLPK
jgi:hypothetical protein